MFLSDNDWSDDEHDDVADFPEWLVAEQKFDKNMSILTRFKNHIKLQPKFIGIDYISGVEMMNLIENGKKSKRERLDEYEVELFDDLYVALFGVKGSRGVYEAVTDGIFRKCYV